MRTPRALKPPDFSAAATVLSSQRCNNRSLSVRGVALPNFQSLVKHLQSILAVPRLAGDPLGNGVVLVAVTDSIQIGSDWPSWDVVQGGKAGDLRQRAVVSIVRAAGSTGNADFELLADDVVS